MKTAAKAAKQLKKELKKAFPDTKFSVRSDNFSGGNAVRVSWENGPLTEDVKRISNKYQYGNFDMMRDLYVIDNDNDDIPQVKYVTHSRDWDDETKQTLIDEVKNTYANVDEMDRYEIIQRARNIFNEKSYEKVAPALK